MGNIFKDLQPVFEEVRRINKLVADANHFLNPYGYFEKPEIKKRPIDEIGYIRHKKRPLPGH